MFTYSQEQMYSYSLSLNYRYKNDLNQLCIERFTDFKSGEKELVITLRLHSSTASRFRPEDLDLQFQSNLALPMGK